ncbi:hypothetical protein NQZ68_007080 [Dissostichus eleginoides]|nr:hypothetical protein NQZ68_007080 [Dissostichus eleginoides]
MMGSGCRPHHVDVVLLRTAWLQDSWLSHRTLKLTHPHFLSLSPEAELGSALPQVQVEARVSGSSAPHMVLWSLGLWDPGSKVLGSCG